MKRNAIFTLAAGALVVAACQPTGPAATGNLEADMLPSAEVTAFEAVDARLGYEGARIGHDARGCAVYNAVGPTGLPYSEPLLTPEGARICPD